MRKHCYGYRYISVHTHKKKTTVFLFKIINLVTRYSVYNFPPFIFPFTISDKTDLSQKGLNKHFRPALL